MEKKFWIILICEINGSITFILKKWKFSVLLFILLLIKHFIITKFFIKISKWQFMILQILH